MLYVRNDLRRGGSSFGAALKFMLRVVQVQAQGTNRHLSKLECISMPFRFLLGEAMDIPARIVLQRREPT